MDFVGKSTTGDAERRRAIVAETLARLRAMDDSVEVRTCGIADHALVGVDMDLAGRVEDPRHVVAAGIEAMAEEVGRYDVFVNIEDDIHIDRATFERTVGFARSAAVNEVLLPNRLEPTAAGPECIDLVAIPGWTRLRRRYDDLDLGVALNGHSGIAILTAEQLRYARDRVDLGRRERFHGGYMASAYANLHLPFLLWRTVDPARHHVIHADEWIHNPGRAITPTARPAGGAGTLDDIDVRGLQCTVRGWAIMEDGAAGVPLTVALDGIDVPIRNLRVEERPDVRVVHPDAALGCGFRFGVPLLELPDPLLEAERIALTVGNGPSTMALADLRWRWPARAATEAVASIPVVPDEPALEAPGLRRLFALLGACGCYLEYGSGGSTVAAADRTRTPIVTVETDPGWLDTVEHRVRSRVPDVDLTAIHVDVGPTGEWGFPLSDSGWRGFAAYPFEPWIQLGRRGLSPDLVVIDGRFRSACLLATLLNARPGTVVLVDDYADRPHYRAALQGLIAPVAVHGRMAEFHIPDDVPASAVSLALAGAIGDPR